MNYKLQQMIGHMIEDECDDYITLWVTPKDVVITFQESDDAEEIEIQMLERHADDPDHPVLIPSYHNLFDVIDCNQYGKIGARINVYEKVIVIGG